MGKILLLAWMLLLPMYSGASVILFDGTPDTDFQDGTLTTVNGSGVVGGFWSPSPSNTTTNGHGVDGLEILFDGPVLFETLRVANSNGLTSLDIVLFNSVNSLLATLSLSDFSGQFETLVFNTPNVSRVQFNRTGNISGPFGIGDSGWYQVSDVTYQRSSVPEPATLALLGLGLVGIGYRRKKAA